MDLYAQNIMDHYKNPRNSGSLDDPTISHSEANYSCGDKVNLDLIIEGDKIIDIKFVGTGCAISVASMSIIGEWIKQKTMSQILEMTEKDVHNHLGVPIGDRRRKCALLSLLTLKNAIYQYQGKPLLKWIDLVDEEDE